MGTLNLITDVAGVRVGDAADARVATGVTAIAFDTPNVASGVIGGGAPGTGGAGSGLGTNTSPQVPRMREPTVRDFFVAGID